MQQTTINQRLKFLIETLSLSVRAFSEQIGESPGNTNNYIGARQLAPKHEYLAKVLKHFSNISAHWLITGEGEPFLNDTQFEQNVSVKKNQGNVIGTNNGSVVHANGFDTLAECEKEIKHLRAQIDLLREQLATKDALIAAKEEMLALLRGSHNRPN